MENNEDLISLITTDFNQFNWRSEHDITKTNQMNRFGIIGIFIDIYIYIINDNNIYVYIFF